jgi:hypothetical protein
MAPPSRWFRLPCWLMAAYFLFAVVVQYNDPDPIRWMAIYGGAMIVSAILPMQRSAALPGLVLAAISLVWGLVLLHGIWGKVEFSDIVTKMSEKGGAVEEERECGGLVIEFAWLAIACGYRLRRA